MPIYEYRCVKCGFEEEYLQKVSDPLKTDCPKCNEPTLQKKLTAAGFQLKGSGWYVTDFRNNNAKPAAKSGEDKSAKSSESATGDAAKGESKAAAKTESKSAGSESSGTSTDSGKASSSTPSTGT